MIFMAVPTIMNSSTMILSHHIL